VDWFEEEEMKEGQLLVHSFAVVVGYYLSSQLHFFLNDNGFFSLHPQNLHNHHHLDYHHSCLSWGWGKHVFDLLYYNWG